MNWSKPIVDRLNKDISKLACHCNRCECGHRIMIQPELIEAILKIESNLNIQLDFTCGYRCVEHNAEVGGVFNSRHLDGRAVDIVMPQQQPINEVIKCCHQYFGGVKLYYEKNIIHLQLDAPRT